MPQIRSLMTGRPVITLPEESSVIEAARAMTKNNVGAILVTRKAGEPCGIFTERDLMVRVVVPGRDPAGVRLAEVMTRELFSAAPDQRIADARRELQRRHIRHLPILEGGRVVEVLSLRDLLRADLEQTSNELQETRRYIQGEVSELPEG